MKHVTALKRKALFAPLIASASVQAASMVLRPGQTSGDTPENEHPKAEQWLFVASGTGRVRVGRRSVKLRAGSLLLIEKGERHLITGTGTEPLVTVNFYAPPAYTPAGEVKRSAGRK